MKKNLKILGISHKEGEKNGKAYDFYIVYASYEDPRVEGVATLEAMCFDKDVADLVVGATYDCWLQFFNGKYKLLAFLG